jgi:hypothetical protein
MARRAVEPLDAAAARTNTAARDVKPFTSKVRVRSSASRGFGSIASTLPSCPAASAIRSEK